MFRSRNGVASALPAGAAMLVAGACGSSSHSNSSPTTAASASGSSAPASSGSGSSGTGTPVKVGLICSCTGAFGSEQADGAKAMEAWVDSVNASGGVAGHPIKLDYKDDGGSPGTSLTDVQQLISDHVSVILDNSLFDETWTKSVDPAGIPVVGGNFTTEPYYDDPNYYATGETNDSIVYSNVATAKASGGTKIGLLYCAESPQCQQSVAPTKAAAGKLGVALSYQNSISMTAPNYTAQCLAAKQAGVNALIILDGPTTIQRVASDCTEQGYTPSFVMEGTSYEVADVTSTGLKDHLWAASPVLPFFVNAPEVTQMNKAMDKYMPGVREKADVWSVVATQGWTGALAVGQAITASGVAASGDVTAADITKALNTFSHQTLGGWSPPLTFTAGKPHPVDCWYTVQVQGSAPSLVNGGKLSCQSA